MIKTAYVDGPQLGKIHKSIDFHVEIIEGITYYKHTFAILVYIGYDCFRVYTDIISTYAEIKYINHKNVVKYGVFYCEQLEGKPYNLDKIIKDHKHRVQPVNPINQLTGYGLTKTKLSWKERITGRLA